MVIVRIVGDRLKMLRRQVSIISAVYEFETKNDSKWLKCFRDKVIGHKL